MGQTLTHGIYLPEEGERNCYNGLAANWSILDGAVGTVAEHTTALAGKAPAVHTHTKSDVTDLFNSANTWSANNTYSANCIIYNSDNSGSVATLRLRNSKAEVLSTGNTTSDQSITFRDKNDVAISFIRGAVQSNGVALKIGTTARDSSNNTVNTELQLLAYSNGNKAIFPSTADVYDFGLSSYQWKSIFAKNYFYNGVAWGLDKSNVWSGNNTFTGRTSYVGIYDKFQTTAFDVRTDPESTRGGDIFRFWSGTGSTYGDYLGGMSFYQSTDGSLTLQLICFGYPQTGNSKQNRINFHSARDGTSAFYPVQNNNINLGTSTNKWKSFNGINPGALSLLDYNNALDVTSEVPVASLDGNTNIDLNDYIPNKTGWLSIVIANTTGNFIKAVQGRAGTAAGFNATRTYHSGAADNEVISLFMPIIAGTWKSVYIKASSLIQMRFYYCLGNV